ncbi:hypothetical protein SIN8267_01328 [Sinobacterium norvegicum]|uniref:SnoaL-like domain-containing protein n=1 Tax=Sinobacterium norvegicum TaxID=1641715 RepID=A0ABM9ADV4_9GAMM|nr:nuclear transport factor 2 family protein [Sinobacterium norvegicum]CAH0991226.1 hypothetical protein SIN8267_01328 [Sinobacterium norvegicum]
MMTTVNTTTERHNPLIEDFKRFYRDMKYGKAVDISDIYADNVIFVDPIHKLQGLDNLSAYLDHSLENVTECRFEFLDIIASDSIAYIKWRMHYHHPKISAQPQTLKGISHLHFDQKITFHEDVYDMGSMVYEHLPIIGRIIGYIKRRIARG